MMPSRGPKLPKKQIHVKAGMHVYMFGNSGGSFTQNGRQKNVLKESPLTGSYSQASLSLDFPSRRRITFKTKASGEGNSTNNFKNFLEPDFILPLC